MESPRIPRPVPTSATAVLPGCPLHKAPWDLPSPCTTAAPAAPLRHPLHRAPWDTSFTPTSASDTQLGCPLHREPRDTPGCTHFTYSCPVRAFSESLRTVPVHDHFSSCHPIRTAPTESALGLQAHARHRSTQPKPLSTHSLHRDGHTQDHPFKVRSSCST